MVTALVRNLTYSVNWSNMRIGFAANKCMSLEHKVTMIFTRKLCMYPSGLKRT